MRSLRFVGTLAVGLTVLSACEQTPNGSLAFDEESEVFGLTNGVALFDEVFELSLSELGELSVDQLTEVATKLKITYIEDCKGMKSPHGRDVTIYPYKKVLDRVHATLTPKTHVNNITALRCKHPPVFGHLLEPSVIESPEFIWDPENQKLDIGDVIDSYEAGVSITVNGQTVQADLSLYQSFEKGFTQTCKTGSLEIANLVNAARERLYPFIKDDFGFPDLIASDVPSGVCEKVPGSENFQATTQNPFDTPATKAFIEAQTNKAKAACKKAKIEAAAAVGALAGVHGGGGFIVGASMHQSFIEASKHFPSVTSANQKLSNLKRASAPNIKLVACEGP